MEEPGSCGSEAQRERVLSVEDWLRKWSTGATGFHKEHEHPLLQKYLDLLVDGRSGLRIFFPLCGKAVDMKWLADMGHSIVGVDVSEQALKEFFADQSLPYCEEPVPGITGAKKLQSTSGNICLYCCSIYDLSRMELDAQRGRSTQMAQQALRPRQPGNQTQGKITA